MAFSAQQHNDGYMFIVNIVQLGVEAGAKYADANRATWRCPKCND